MTNKTKVWSQLNNKSGFTLVEIIITISIVAIAAGLSGFGLHGLFNANLDHMAHDIATDLRGSRFRTVSEIDTDYQFVFTYDSVKDKYGYEIQKRSPDDLGAMVITTTKSVDYKPYLILLRYNDSVIGSEEDKWQELSAPEVDIANFPKEGTFIFTSFTGGIGEVNFGGVEIGSLISNSTDTVGRYKIYNERTNEEIIFEVIEKTGRVLVYE